MIDHTLLKPAAAVVLAGAVAAALTVGQSAFAVGRAATTTGHAGAAARAAAASRAAPAACTASDQASYTPQAGHRRRWVPGWLTARFAGQPTAGTCWPTRPG